MTHNLQLKSYLGHNSLTERCKIYTHIKTEEKIPGYLNYHTMDNRTI